MRKGQKVRIIESEEPYFRKGDIATLTDKDGREWWGDFTNNGNNEVYGDGFWCIGAGGCEVTGGE